MSDDDDQKAVVEKLEKARDDIYREISKVIVGQEEVIEQTILTMLSAGHCLLIGVPGLGKTLTVKTIARIFDLDFRRIQFTPDLMPADIIGTDILQEDKTTGVRELKFIKGPIFTNILLADEINRTPPKTQAALLEAMGELQVTAGGQTFQLSPPFFTLASQNPIEQEGTYPLPEAQLDRFLMSINIDYLPLEKEEEMVLKTTTGKQEEIQPIISGEEVLHLQELVREVPVSKNVLNYAVRLSVSTRPGSELASDEVNRYIKWGAGSRASQALILTGKARALFNGRYNVAIEDVQAVSRPVLRHRIATNFRASADGLTVENLINNILDKLPEN